MGETLKGVIRIAFEMKVCYYYIWVFVCLQSNYYESSWLIWQNDEKCYLKKSVTGIVTNRNPSDIEIGFMNRRVDSVCTYIFNTNAYIRY